MAGADRAALGIDVGSLGLDASDLAKLAVATSGRCDGAAGVVGCRRRAG